MASEVAGRKRESEPRRDETALLENRLREMTEVRVEPGSISYYTTQVVLAQ